MAERRRWRRRTIRVALGLLLAAWGVGVWATMFRGTVQEITGVYVTRLGGGMILVQHDALPGLGMTEMELMAIAVEPAAILDEVELARGDRVRLTVRQRADGVVATRVRKVSD